MFPPPLPNDTDSLKRLLLEQAKHIEYLQLQLAQSNSTSSSLKPNAFSAPQPSTPFTSGTTSSDPIVKSKVEEANVSSIRNEQILSPLPSAESEDQNNVSPDTTTNPPAHTTHIQTYDLKEFPSKETLKRRLMAAIEKDYYDKDTHYNNLMELDSRLPIQTKAARWTFATRFCAHFLLTGGKRASIQKMRHQRMRQRGRNMIRMSAFPGLEKFLVSKCNRIRYGMFMVPSKKTRCHFSYPKNKLEIIEFLHALCSFLYTFLPPEKSFLDMDEISRAKSEPVDNKME